MRLTTLASAVALALFSAALAQVATAPEEQKLPGGNDLISPGETASPTPSPVPTATPEPGAPSTALVNSVGDEPGPVEQRSPK